MSTPTTPKMRATITHLGEGGQMEWRVFMSPRGPQDFEGDAIRAPYGDTFWPTHEEACSFVAKVFAEAAGQSKHGASVVQGNG